ncbi:MAG: hypothetical protein KBE04_07390 [Phycisphaerae bacterium]|nr:hypothetical protein [Phycisphaerae bacterium]
MAKQLNIFMENSPGRLRAVSENLKRSSIDVRAFTIQDQGEYGLLKLIVNKPSEAYLALADLGCACALKDILAIWIPDEVGNFNRLASALAAHGINVIGAYGYVIQPRKTGIACLEMKPEDLDRAQKVVEEAGFKVLGDDELYAL